MKNKLSRLWKSILWIIFNPFKTIKLVEVNQLTKSAEEINSKLSNSKILSENQSFSNNRLREYFYSNKTGNGIWKWDHYFDIYEKHVSKFINKAPIIVEIGVYSGGSLNMWKSYFGDDAVVYGVDIMEECKEYEDIENQIFIEIGDQSDPKFWSKFYEKVGSVDVIIDDGGHLFQQQISTLESSLSFLNYGGVYLCEDIHGLENKYIGYLNGLLKVQNKWKVERETPLTLEVNDFQSAVKGIYFHPFVGVIEKRDKPLQNLVAPKMGTKWEPFLN